MAVQFIAIVSLVAGVIGILMNFARTPPEEATENLGKWARFLWPSEFLFRKAVAFSTSAAGRTLSGVLFATGIAILAVQPTLHVKKAELSAASPTSGCTPAPCKPGEQFVLQDLSDAQLRHIVFFQVLELREQERKFAERIANRSEADRAKAEEYERFYQRYWPAMRPVALEVVRRLTLRDGESAVFAETVSRFDQGLVDHEPFSILADLMSGLEHRL